MSAFLDRISKLGQTGVVSSFSQLLLADGGFLRLIWVWLALTIYLFRKPTFRMQFWTSLAPVASEEQGHSVYETDGVLTSIKRFPTELIF